MIKKKALITGISGQDGSYLAELLLSKDYEVFGIIRRHSIPETQECRIDHLVDSGDVKTEYGDLLDTRSLVRVLKMVKPDEVYNLASQSHVGISFQEPIITCRINAIGVLNLLESLHDIVPNTRFYQASSSEMFGNSIDPDGYQRETTSMQPVSPYGCSKVFGYNVTKFYREAYKVFACNGILFNHESPRRASNFVTAKVIKAAISIENGLQDELVLGNMDSKRDWGHSKDYVRAMHMILNYDEPCDFVVSTGETRSVRDLCLHVFEKLGLDYTKYVRIDKKYVRAKELHLLRGDSTKIRTTLGWVPEYTFETLMEEMLEHWKGKER